MIEINLVPDVKQELIRAERLRTTVISVATLIGIVSGGIVVVLSLYVFGGQTLRSSLADNAIKSEQGKIAKVSGLDNALTIQAQLQRLSTLGGERQVNSRIFDLLSTIVPPEPNNVAISKTTVNTEEKTISIEAQADNGFAALEVFRKTIQATRLEYSVNNATESVALASNVSDSGRSYGEDASGRKVVRFTVSFTYADQLFARSTSKATIVGPDRKNVTDSFKGVPASLFTSRAADSKEGDN